MNLKYYLFLVLFNLNLNGSYKSKENIEIEVKELLLARENCNFEYFSFCYDGLDQPFRMYPVFVELNKNSPLDSYDTIYIFLNDSAMRELDRNGIKYDFPWELNYLFDSTVAFKVDSTYFFEFKNFNCKLKRYYKRIGSHKSNEYYKGYFSFIEYKLKLKLLKRGVTTILLPDIRRGSKGLIFSKEVFVYFICSIDTTYARSD